MIEDDTILKECDVVLRKYAANMRDGGAKRMEFWRKRKCYKIHSNSFIAICFKNNFSNVMR